MTYTTDLRIPDPPRHILHEHQIVLCAYPTQGIHYGQRYIVNEIIHDPQGDMIEAIGYDTPHRGVYWLWRFRPVPA